MCVRLLTTVIVAPAADVGTTMPLNSPAFGAAGKATPCLSHTLFDPPPNAKAKAATDMVAAAKENKAARSARSAAHRLAPAATSAFVTDDEDDSGFED